MPRDYAKQRKQGSRRAKPNTRKRQPASQPSRGWQWYSAGLLSGVLLSLLLYLGSLPSGPGSTPQTDSNLAEIEPPKPRFDFYTLLPEQTIDLDVAPDQSVVAAANSTSSGFYLLQAGSFKQREDADRRRAQLLLLGLDPTIEETNGDNGRWYRVYLGPFKSRTKLNKARSLTAAQNIDTLLLKRGTL